ncbi:MAG: glucose 1-dehydrogenase [Gammaproteobacteria bacterium]|nr:glucose 1-dehydrogenase [Gammaproteobacteria bacterium]
MGKLEGKTAIVTGGTRGIGRAIVERFVREGAHVVVAGRGELRLPFTTGADRVDFQRADVSMSEDVVRLIQYASDRTKRLDILINNAGIEMEKTVEHTTEDEWDQLMGVNLKGVFLCSKYAIPHMRQQGGGVIINLASISALVADKGLAAYNASKAGVTGLTRSIAVDHGEDGIRCNAICPGWIETDMLKQTFSVAADPEAARRAAISRHPVGRLGCPEDIANMALWLSCDESEFVTGQCFTADGGLIAGSPVDPAVD